MHECVVVFRHANIVCYIGKGEKCYVLGVPKRRNPFKYHVESWLGRLGNMPYALAASRPFNPTTWLSFQSVNCFINFHGEAFRWTPRVLFLCLKTRDKNTPYVYIIVHTITYETWAYV